MIEQDAERALLGAALTEPEAYYRVADRVSADHFYSVQHQVIWETAAEIRAAGEEPDAVVMIDRLSERGRLDAAGGAAEIVSLLDAYPDVTNVDHYATLVLGHWQRRRFESICTSAPHRAGTTEEILAGVIADLADLVAPGSSAVWAGPAAAEELERIIARRAGLTEGGLHTGYPGIDRSWGGLNPGMVAVIAARPAVGKSALAMSIVHEVAVVKKRPVYFASLEMSNSDIAHRLMAIDSSVSVSSIRDATLSDNNLESLGKVVERLDGVSLQLDDQPALTLTQLNARARRMKAERGLDLVVVDYLQLMGGKAENRRELVASNARGLKVLAKELEVPVIACAQLNRQSEYRENNEPRLADLRESGEIEQSADIVGLLVRNEEDATLITAKNRQGPTGRCRLRYDMRKTLFLSHREDVLGWG